MASKLSLCKDYVSKIPVSNTSKVSLDCIMPAAGLSSRMGQWKIMLPYQDITILEASIKNALSLCSRVILVAGYRADEVIEKMHGYPNVKVVINKDYQQGMFSSIQAGLKHINSDFFFIAHADMPCLSTNLYHKLWQARREGSVFPGSEHQSGHPVLIDSVIKETILNQSASASMKSVLNNFPMHYLNLTETTMHFDVDTVDDYKKLCTEF